jgi:hypothetical protein
VGGDISVDSKTFLVIDLNLKIKPVQSFRYTYKGMVSMRVLNECSYVYEYLYLYCVSKKNYMYIYINTRETSLRLQIKVTLLISCRCKHAKRIFG